MSSKNPYSSRLGWVSGLGLAVGVILIIVGTLVDATAYDNVLGVDFEVLQIKIALIAAGNALGSLGIIAIIGWAVLAGVRWQLLAQSRDQQAQKTTRATASPATPSGPRTLDEIRGQSQNGFEKSTPVDGHPLGDR